MVNGSSPLEGRLEICINNAWGTVCRESFSSDDARVACRQLGNITGTTCLCLSCSDSDILLIIDLQQPADPIVDNTFGSGYGPILLNRLNCEGEESDILSCVNPLYVHRCTHVEDVGVRCPG